MRLSWTNFKAFIDARKVPIQEYPLDDTNYLLQAFDGPILRACKIRNGTADYTDYTDNYQSTANKTLSDNDGALLQRVKIAPRGWTLIVRGIEMETSQLNSIVNDKHDGTAWGDATLKFYDSNDVELTTQGDLDTSCVKTVLDFEPLYDYEIIGGSAYVESAPASDIRLWCIGVPDLTEAQGGSKIMINGVNFLYTTTIQIDGRSPKRMNYDATYHTNKLRKIFKHSAGMKCKFSVLWEHYKL